MNAISIDSLATSIKSCKLRRTPGDLRAIIPAITFQKRMITNSANAKFINHANIVIASDASTFPLRSPSTPPGKRDNLRPDVAACLI